MKDVILVPTDFSEVCDNALKHAVQAARYLKYKIVLLHVIDKNTKAFLRKEGKESDFINEKLEQLAKPLRDESLNVETKTLEGDIFITIGEQAKAVDAKLVFLGTHGKAGMQKLTGSYALKVITSSPTPVIVVQKRAFENGFKEIVLPITDEAGPWEKTKWAVFMAKEFGANIHIFEIGGAPQGVKDASSRIAQYLGKNDVPHTHETAEKGSNFTRQVIDYATAKMLI